MKTGQYRECNNEAGFSLLETLFALAIMSLASVALFQSTSTMLMLSDRAVKAGERSLNSALDQRTLANLTSRLVIGWPEDKAAVFQGSPQSFRGVSTGAPRAGIAAPVKFELRFEDRGVLGGALVYRSIPEGRFENDKDDAEDWVLRSGYPSGAALSYMGVDHAYHDVWPPKNKPSRGYFDEDKFMPMPGLPEAVSLKTADGTTLWTAVIGRSKALPHRLRPGFGL